MMKNLHDEAVGLLESPLTYPGLPEHRHPRVLLRVWRHPSFEPYASWSLIETQTASFVRRITWDPFHLLADTPVTYGAEAVIPAAVYEPLLSALRGIQLPAFQPAGNAVGIDGTTYGVESGNYMHSARVTWWETPPTQWAALARWHADAIARFESLLPAMTPSVRDR